jgi:hypothetical protein
MPGISHNEFEAEDDARTLQRSAEIVQDKKRHKRAMKKMGAMKKAIETAQTIHDKF